MTITERPSTTAGTDISVLTRLIVDLLTDDQGREALAGLLADELAKRELRCRGLTVVDRFGRHRIEAKVTDTAGELKVNGFSASDPDDLHCSFAGFAAEEECDSDHPGVHLNLWSADHQVFGVSAMEGRHGRPGAPEMQLERLEHDGGYLPGGGLRFTKTAELNITAHGVDHGAIR